MLFRYRRPVLDVWDICNRMDEVMVLNKMLKKLILQIEKVKELIFIQINDDSIVLVMLSN